MQVGAAGCNHRLRVEPISSRRNLRPDSFNIQPGRSPVGAYFYDGEASELVSGPFGGPASLCGSG